MSDYPATPSYGMGYGAQDQTNPPYLPPQYPNQYLQPGDSRMGQAGMPSSYDASMSAYGYGGGGAPSFSAAAVASGVPPLPIFQGWNQDPVPIPPYAAAHAASQYSGYPNNGHQNSQYYAPPAQHAYQQPQSTSRPYDEGELSDGEFENNGNHSNNGPIISTYESIQYRGNDGPNHVDMAQRSAYPGGREQDPQTSYNSSNNYNYRDSPQMRPQQSDAYSPFHSPRPTDRGEQVNPNKDNNSYAASHHVGHTNGPTQKQYGKAQDNEKNPSRAPSHTNGHRPSLNGGHTESNSAAAQRPSSPSDHHLPNAQAVVEARKKAQNAVMNLYPHSIRFQTYVDEGMGEVAGSLFDELGLSREAVYVGGDTIENQLASAPRASGEENGISQLGPLSTLANGKQPAKNGSASDHPSTIPATSTTAVAKPTGMTDKEKTLQSKMDALRKSREERAQKAAAKNSAKSPTDSTSLAPAQTLPAASAPPSTNNTSSLAAKPAALPLQPQTSGSSAPVQSPKQIVNTQQQGPTIPGLFLASTAASPAPSASTQGPVITQTSQRKRPVAADFDPPASTPFKRPFGQSRNERPLVIDVSDEEPDSDDEDVAMDLESQADQDSPMLSSRNLSDQRSMSLQNMPPLTDFSSNKHFTPPSNSSAPGTPPVSQQAPKAAIGRPEVLQRKETEIEELKKKIAEAEARKKARQTPSGTRTPRAVEIPASDAKDTATANANLASKVEASMKMQHLIDVAENKVSSDQQKLAEVQAAELQKAAELSRNEAERKRLRREKLATDLPLVDAEVQQTQTKLEQLKAEIARLEAEVNKNLEAKRAMAEEMERLGQETEDQLQAQKDKLQNLTQEETVSSDGPSHQTSSNPAEVNFETSPPEAGSAQALPSESRLSDNPPAVVSVNGPTQVQPPTRAPAGTTATYNTEETYTPAEHHSNVTSISISEPKDHGSADRSLEAALQEDARAQADSHGHEGSDIEMETSFAPDPTQLAPDSASNSGEEEVDSPMYSPVLDRTIAETDAESDIYEPPEATPPVDRSSPIESPPFSPAPPESVSKPAIVDDSIQVVDEPAQSDRGDDQNGSIPQLIHANSEENLSKIPSFTPYESPLKTFRAFRFHPDYKQQVTGGLRSLTYNHKINPALEFCRYELAGGVCNDPQCEFQHFKDIGLPDDAVLTALGSPEEFSAEQRDRFCQGLRGVLTDLRARKIKDFDVIAAEIVAHRSQFLGDNSKILNLEGTTI